MTPDVLLASPRATALALAALTYDNAILTYALLTWPKADTYGAAAWKVFASLPWLLALATPFAVLFGIGGGALARRVFAAQRDRGVLAALLLALAAFILPAATLTEGALALRDGWSWTRWGIQLAGGTAIAMLGATLLDWTPDDRSGDPRR